MARIQPCVKYTIPKRANSTVPITLNVVAGPMVGRKIRLARQKAGLTMEQLCIRAGIVSATPKQRMYEIEMGSRAEGVRLGTLYAIAYALGVRVEALMPPVDEVLAASGAEFKVVERLAL